MPECPECGNRGRHKATCSRKRKNSPRGSLAGTRAEVFLDRFKEKIKEAADGVLAACIRACMEEAEARRGRIEEEARERLRALDEVLPRPARPQAASPAPAGLPTHEAPPVPAHLQCGKQSPDDSKTYCTQPRNHDGLCRNAQTKKTWQGTRRIA